MILLAFVVFLRFEIPRVMPKLSPIILLRLLALVGYKLAYLAVLALFSAVALAADEVDYPSAAPVMIYIDDDGQEVSDATSYAGGAPFSVRFEARPENLGKYQARYEWRFLKDGSATPFLTRFEENTEYRFVESGTSYVSLFVTFTADGDTLEYEMDEPFVINIAESKLEVPNAFTPNGDGINDVFRVKEGYESIVEFRAVVFSRSGRKIYEWNDPADGWDGTMNGKGGTAAPDGAYYLIINAKGADGLTYHYKKTINLLRGFKESMTGGGV